MTETAKAGHNSGLDPAQERAFIREFTAIKEVESEMAENKGVLSGIYKRLENAGFDKEDIKFAKSLEKKNVAEEAEGSEDDGDGDSDDDWEAAAPQLQAAGLH